jgi:glycine/D-amino acid oxidase-like deaminating enzyme
MKKTADIVIIGGGVEGCSIAYHLARSGCTNVVLVEKNVLASGSTGKSCGIIRTHYSQETLMEMAHKSMRVFGHFEEEFDKESGFVTNGLVFLGTKEETPGLRDVTAMQKRLGIRADLVAPDDLPRFHPDITIDGIDLASYEPDAGFADPYGVTIGFASAASRLGVEINEGVEVTGIDIEGGRVRGAITTQGRVAAPIVVNAAGPWGHRVGAMAGVDLPLFPIRFQEAVMRPGKDYPLSMPTVFDQRTLCYYRPESGGFMIFGGGVIEMQLIQDPDNYSERPDNEWVENVASVLLGAMNDAQDTKFIRGWAGPITLTPDFNPIIGAVDEVDGFFVAGGFSGHGFKLSPMVGQCMAELILNGVATSVDIGPLRPSRHREGIYFQSKYPRSPLT